MHSTTPKQVWSPEQCDERGTHELWGQVTGLQTFSPLEGTFRLSAQEYDGHWPDVEQQLCIQLLLESQVFEEVPHWVVEYTTSIN